MNLLEFFNFIVEELTTLGNAALTFVKVFLNVFVKVLEFLVDLIRRGLGSF